METMPIVLIVVLMCFMLVLLWIRKKNQGGTTNSNKTNNKVSKNKPAGVKQAKSGVAVKSSEPTTASTHNTDLTSAEALANTEIAQAELNQNGFSQPVKVTVQEVDPLTEYKVYREFGYLDKAAEALAAYLSTQPSKDSTLLFELAEIYLETEQYETLVDFVLENRNVFDEEQLSQLVKSGLEADPNNLELRVLADELLNWNVETINSQILQNDHANTSSNQMVESLATQAAAFENDVESSHIVGSHGRLTQLDPADKLVVGHGIIQNISHEELQVLSVMLPSDNAVKLMRGFADYATFSHKLDRVLPKLKNPASALIDALGLDFQNKNIDAFARHLWELYSVLGKNGQNIKDKMLGWGYGLGNHELFNRLAMIASEQEVKDIGREFGYRTQVKKSQSTSMPLVSDDGGVGLSRSLGRDVNSILQEADAYLMYGQLEEAMKTLEQGIKVYKNEPQLYINLFELYERAENWERLEEFSKRLRTDAGNLPEEVMLAMSQLTQKLKNNNIGMVA